jgi:hypothetical protein
MKGEAATAKSARAARTKVAVSRIEGRVVVIGVLQVLGFR